MPEASAEALGSEQVFRVGNRVLILIVALVALTGTVPISSLHELLTTGRIDLEAVSQTRQRIPVWILYATAWPIFTLTLWSILPALRYFRDREMMRLGPEGISIRGETYAPGEVLGFRSTLLRGYVMRTERGDVSIHPYMVKGAPEALTQALPHLPPLRSNSVSEWWLDA